MVVTLKLETWLRMNKIKYENVYSMILGSKGQTPYVELNGKEITDSNLIMETLGKQFGDCDDGVLGRGHFTRKTLRKTIKFCITTILSYFRRQHRNVELVFGSLFIVHTLL